MRSLAAIAFALSSVLVQAQDNSAAVADPKQRAKNAREYGKQGSEAIPALVPMLSDESLDVRMEAVKSLTTIGGPSSIEPLIQATRDNDPAVQIRAVDGLVGFYLPGYKESGFGTYIKGKFSSENSQVIDPYVKVREDVVAAIGRVVRGGSSMESRANAARGVGILRGRPAIPDLVEALKTKDDDVIFESLIAIQKIKDESVAPKILFLLNDLKEKIQIAAIETAGLLRNKEAVPDLLRIYNGDRGIKVRRAALAAVAMLADERGRPVFQKALTDKDDAIRAAAAEGMGRLGNKADVSTLRPRFDDERKMAPRLALAFALVNLGSIEGGEFSPRQYLINTLNSKSYRGVAEPYLIELARREDIRATLYQAAKAGTKDEKIGLSRVLSTSGGQDSMASLEALAKDPDADVAEAGLRALRNLKARLQ